MERKPIHITNVDMQRLRSLMRDLNASGSPDAPYIRALDEELNRAIVEEPQQIAADIITLHSCAILKDLDTGEEEQYTLVYPNESDPSNHKVSILAPIGTALLGYRAGDTFEWKVPKGIRRLKVLKVAYQPEAHGDFHL